MRDLIDRAAAIDAVGNMLRRKFGIGGDLAEITLTDLPSAQPEIVRCKDCVHKWVAGEERRYNICFLNHNKAQSDDWFCADAERRPT